MFSDMGPLGELMRAFQDVSRRVEEKQEELARLRFTGTAGGGMVTVEVDGLIKAHRCKIDPKLIAAADAEVIEELIVAAFNDAAEKVHEVAAKDIPGETDTPDLASIFSMIGGGFGVDEDDEDYDDEDGFIEWDEDDEEEEFLPPPPVAEKPRKSSSKGQKAAGKKKNKKQDEGPAS